MLRGGRGGARVLGQLVHGDGDGDQDRGQQHRGRDVRSLACRGDRPEQHRDRGDRGDRDGLGAVLLQRDQQDNRQVQRERDHGFRVRQGLDREDGRQRGKWRGSANQHSCPRD